MPLSHIDHYLIQTTDMEATRDWYVRILGMEEGPHPDFRFPVVWLYLNGTDVLHLSQGGANVSENRLKYLGQESEDTSGSGVIDHVAFKATGLRDMIQRLDAEGVDYTKRRVNPDGNFQLFIKGPDGVKIELNFDMSEIDGVEPELLASELDV